LLPLLAAAQLLAMSSKFHPAQGDEDPLNARRGVWMTATLYQPNLRRATDEWLLFALAFKCGRHSFLQFKKLSQLRWLF